MRIPRRGGLPAAVIVLLGCLLASCVGPSEEPAAGQRDRLPLFENPTLLAEIDTDPLSVGVVSSFYLSDNGFLGIADSFNARVHILDTLGSVVSVVGRKGSGPGEMLAPTDLWLGRDTLLVVDVGLGRLSAFDVDGQFLGSANIDGIRSTLIDGGAAPYLIVSSGSTPANLSLDILEVDASEAKVGRTAVADAEPRTDLCLLCPLVESPSGGFLFSAGDSFVITEVSRAGVVEGTFEWPRDVPLHTEQSWARYWSRSVRQDEVKASAIAGVPVSLPRDMGLPVGSRPMRPFSRLGGYGVDGMGRVWTLPVASPGAESELVAFSANGELLGSFPLGFRGEALKVSGPYLVVMSFTELDVPWFRVYRISGPQ